MSKHTPGPWLWRHSANYIVNARAEVVCENIAATAPNGAPAHTETTEANARLIAAAPTLLEACRRAHARLTAMALVSGHLALAPTLQELGDAIEAATKEQ